MSEGNASAPAGDQLMADALASQAVYTAELLRWKQAFDAYVHRGINYEQLGIITIRLHYLTSHITVVTVLAPDEMAYDDFTLEMKQLVDLSREALGFLNKTPVRFTVDLGVVVPLYFVALKCRLHHIRSQAVKLLVSNPRREGLWDSVFAGKAAEWVQKVEEEHQDNGQIPSWARVRNVHTTFNLQRRKADLECRQRLAENGEFISKFGSITW
ncbi:hypothetical protein BP5796_05503 [Coleophoma crateriformis]|uniref:Uncharacterized protein n=1 Tax=Coleophoma crateriformis TaxID=565419 RepID=A0A3D8S3F6_9HELO|nr:hypothetical protein BP5796_05503 [Coleophoma crateriformis]